VLGELKKESFRGTRPRKSDIKFGAVRALRLSCASATLLRRLCEHRVIASGVAAWQSPAWNKYNRYCFLSAEIATGASTLAMTLFRLTRVIASEQREQPNPLHENKNIRGI